MKVLLVVPPYRTTDRLVSQLYPQPLGLVLLGTVLQAQGHAVVIKDFLLPPETSSTPSPASFKDKGGPPPYRHYGQTMTACKAWLSANAPSFDVVGLAMGQCNIYETGAELAHYIKRLGLPLMIGGPFVTTATDQAMALTGADLAVTGEAEGVIGEALEIARKRRPTVLNGFPVDMSAIPLPNWGLAPPGNYPRYQNRVRGVLAISRGCPHSCSFCSVHTVAGRVHRRQDIPRIQAELVNLWRQGVRYFCFLDDNLFFSERSTNELLAALRDLRNRIPGFGKARFYVEEGIEVRIAAKPRLIPRIVAAGFDSVAIGLETMNEARRQDTKKPFTTPQLAAAVQNCHAAGITAKAFYIVGFEGDTVETVTRDLVEFGRLGLAARPNNLKLYPGTDTTKRFLDAGYIDETYDWRLSSWYTPYSGGLTYRQIKRLKTIIGAIGFAADQFGLALLRDGGGTIVKALAHKHYRLGRDADGGLVIEGNIYRATPYRRMVELLLLRQGAQGVMSETGKRYVRAWAIDEPADEIQAGLVAALALGP